MPLNEVLLPEHLNKLGYVSHAVGKWHLGYFRKTYTPTFRGFKSFYGFWNGYQDYYTHMVQATVSKFDISQQNTFQCFSVDRKQFYFLPASINIEIYKNSCYHYFTM